LDDKDIELKQRERDAKQLEQSLDEFRERYRRRSEEADRLRDDIKIQNEQITSQQTRLIVTSSLRSELEGKLLPMECELARTRHESEGFKSRLAYLEEELLGRDHKELDLRRELSSRTSELESSLVITTSENNGLKETVC
jgi:chromosome segregation ATPase